MEWHSSLIRPSSFSSPSAETSFNFLFNCNLEPFPPSGMDVKHAEMMMMGMERPGGGVGGVYGDAMSTMSDQDKKKRLTCQQLESLEKSFQEEIKLDPERKMRLSRELSLQPRQVAVWFQNRRARWKAKQLEHLYDSLRLQFDVVSREKQRLQDEVMKLRAMLMEQGATRNKNTKQVSMGFTEVSGGDETVESTSAIHGGSAGGGSGGAVLAQPQQLQQNNMGECHNYTMFGGIDDYNTTSTSVASLPLGPYWAALPAYPPC